MKRRVALFACGAIACGSSCAPKHALQRKLKPTLEHASTSASAASPSTAVVPSAAPTASAAARSACVQAAPELTDAAVTSLVERWRQTQKKHDFAGYSALYAEHFSGLTSDGASCSKLDRRAWLSARAVAFGSTSTAPDNNATPQIALGAGGALVTFGARSKAGSVTAPELFVVASADGPKIAREAPARPAASELSAKPGRWLAEERFAILRTTPDPSWAEGAPVLQSENSTQSAIAFARLPRELRAWLGRPVRVFGERGTVCETRLQRFAIRAQISPDLATAEAWDGCSDAHTQAQAAIARDIWRLSAHEGRSLIAEFSTPCKGALFAVDPDAPAPLIAAPRPAPAELGQAALDALRKLPAYARAQARFQAEHADSAGAWDDHDAKRGVWLLELPARPPLLFASVEAGAGCANFSASVSGLWEANANSELRLLDAPNAQDDQRLTPRALVDFGGDGEPELLLGPDGVYRARSLLLKTAAGYEQRLLTSVPFFAGPC